MKKSITFTSIIAIVLLFSFAAIAGTVFEDNFEGSLKWVEITTNQVPTDISSGKLSTNNSGQTLAILKHDDTNINSLTEFTYSVDIERTAGQVQSSGVFFCLPATGIGGYQFYVQEDGVYRFVRWNGTTPSYIDVGDGRTSFRDELKTTLTVSKKGNLISLFCDGEFLGSLEDDGYASGDIGLVVGAGESLTFDNVLVKDNAETGVFRTGFSDDFTGSELKKGWKKLAGNGTFSKEDGSMTISNDIQLWTTGDYDAVACTVVISYQEGDSSKFYGINLVGPNGGSNRTFVLNARKNFAVYSGSGTAKVNSNITGNKDVLIITKDHELIVNGQLLDATTFTTPTEIRGIALYADAGVTASVESIKIGNDTSIPITNKINFTNNSAEYEIGGTGLIYDVRGRQVAQFERENYQSKLQQLGTGQFFVISKNKQHMIKRAIINVK